MIPWWGWLALWSALVIVLLIVIVLAAWLLFRKFARALEEFEELAEKTAILDDVTSDVPARAPTSILEPFSAVRQRRSAREYHAKQQRIERRRGRLARARSIIAVDAMTLRATKARRQ